MSDKKLSHGFLCDRLSEWSIGNAKNIKPTTREILYLKYVGVQKSIDNKKKNLSFSISIL